MSTLINRLLLEKISELVFPPQIFLSEGFPHFPEWVSAAVEHFPRFPPPQFLIEGAPVPKKNLALELFSYVFIRHRYTWGPNTKWLHIFYNRHPFLNTKET